MDERRAAAEDDGVVAAGVDGVAAAAAAAPEPEAALPDAAAAEVEGRRLLPGVGAVTGGSIAALNDSRLAVFELIPSTQSAIDRSTEGCATPDLQ